MSWIKLNIKIEGVSIECTVYSISQRSRKGSRWVVCLLLWLCIASRILQYLGSYSRSFQSTVVTVSYTGVLQIVSHRFHACICMNHKKTETTAGEPANTGRSKNTLQILQEAGHQCCLQVIWHSSAASDERKTPRENLEKDVLCRECDTSYNAQIGRDLKKPIAEH